MRRFIIVSLFLLSILSAQDRVPNLRLKMLNGKHAKLYDFLKDGPMVIDFWATWCAPCREEMPSLDNLQTNKRIKKLKIFPINMEKKNIDKSIKFFSSVDIKNLSIYFDPEFKLSGILSLRGIPTTIFFDRHGKEFARAMGSIDFNDKKFIEWLLQYN